MAKELAHSQIYTPMKKKEGSRVAIIGACGYGGLQTVRLIRDHPNFRVTYLAGNKTAGNKWNDLFPYLYLDKDIEIKKTNIQEIKEVSDYVIMSLPNGLASQLVPDLIASNLRIIDLSADYRFRSLDDWKNIYIKESQRYIRSDFDLCKEAIYGLPEWNKDKIKDSRLVGAPGCFPTASLLSLLPFVNQGLIDTEGLIVDAKSGTSGGGRTPKETLLLAEASEGISPYGVIGHRHTPEIECQLSEYSGIPINIQFTPHLLPMVRGILVTIYARLRDPGLTAEDCTTVLEAIYKDQPFVDILPVGTYPSTKWTRYTNKALISVEVDKRTGRIVIMCAIDNLFKGQAAQAIQCLNCMANISEEIGLPVVTCYP